MRSARVATALVGSGVVALGLWSYQLGLSASRGFSEGKLLLVASGLGLLLVAATWSQTAAAYKGLATVLLNTAVLLLLIEAGLTASARINDLWEKGRSKRKSDEAAAAPQLSVYEMGRLYADDGRENLPYYQQEDWAETYWREYHQVWDSRRLPFKPYTLWRSDPFSGETINIDESGVRVTPGDCPPGALRAFLFGGSSVWGTGVPDWGTIAAYLQAESGSDGGQPLCVANFGEQAWVSSQGLVQLVLELKRGNVPDLVVFYDGNNDLFATYQSGLAGMPQNLRLIEHRFEDRDEVSPWEALLLKTRTYRYLDRLREANGADGSPRRPNLPFDTEGSALATVANYLATYSLVERLSSAYHFDFLMIWQSTLFTESKPLSREEEAIRALAIAVYPGFQELYRNANGLVAAATIDHPRLRSTFDVFSEIHESIYVDPFHVTAGGNRLLARRIASLLRETHTFGSEPVEPLADLP